MAIKKTGLGRGLDALFPEKAPEKKAPVKVQRNRRGEERKPSAAEEVQENRDACKDFYGRTESKPAT